MQYLTPSLQKHITVIPKIADELNSAELFLRIYA